VPTYTYEFRDENAPERFLPPVSFPYGAAHASEIQYLFDLVQTPVPGQLSPEQQQLSTTMLRYWTNFAERSFPSGFSTPPWPRYESAAPQMQTFDPPRPQLRSDFAAEHRCAFWGVSG
jgi:para-nitrobenzyl esterase